LIYSACEFRISCISGVVHGAKDALYLEKSRKGNTVLVSRMIRNLLGFEASTLTTLAATIVPCVTKHASIPDDKDSS